MGGSIRVEAARWGRRRITIDQVLEAVGNEFGVSPTLLHRRSEHATARHALLRGVVALIAHEAIPASYPEIARVLGYRDHTSPMAGARSAQRACALDASFFDRVRAARARVVPPPCTPPLRRASSIGAPLGEGARCNGGAL